MKKITVWSMLLISLLFCLSVFSGCGTTGTTTTISNTSTVSSTTNEVATEILARRMGWTIAKNNTALAEKMENYIAEIIEQTDNQAFSSLAVSGLSYLAEKYTGDALLAADLMSLGKLFGVDITALNSAVTLSGTQLALAKVALNAIISGINSVGNKEYERSIGYTGSDKYIIPKIIVKP